MSEIKHDWYRDEDGNIDIFRLDMDYHNGPQCVRCYFTFCHHCRPEAYDEPCHEQTPYLDGDQ